MSVRLTGSTSNSEYVVLKTPAGGDATGLTLTALTVGYVRDRAAKVTASATALAAVDSAFSACGMFEVGSGLFRVDVPDLAYATGVQKFQLTITGTAISPATMEIDLMDLATDAEIADAVQADPPTMTLADGAITAAKIATSAFTFEKFASDCKSGSSFLAYVTGQANIDFGALQKVSLNAAVPQNSAGVATLLTYVTGAVALASELAKVPKSDGTVSFNATALDTIANAVHDEVIEGAFTFRHLERIFKAIIGGNCTIVDNGNGTHTYNFYDVAGTTIRMAMIVDDTTGTRTISSISGV